MKINDFSFFRGRSWGINSIEKRSKDGVLNGTRFNELKTTPRRPKTVPRRGKTRPSPPKMVSKARQDVPKTRQDAPKTRSDASTTLPRRAKTRPRRAQDGPKTRPRRAQNAPRSRKSLEDAPKTRIWAILVDFLIDFCWIFDGFSMDF